MSLESHMLFGHSHTVSQSESRAKRSRNKPLLVWNQERVSEMRRTTTGILASGICDCALYPLYAVRSYPAAHLQGSLRIFIFLLYLKYPHKLLLGEKEETELVVQRV